MIKNNFRTNAINIFFSKVLLYTGLKRCKMKVILILQIKKIVGVTVQPSFWSTRVLQVNRTVRISFIVYAVYPYSFFI